MAVGYPTVSVNSGERISPESARPRERPRHGTSGAGGSIAFDAVLAATSSMSADSLANRGLFSAEQMFEPAAADTNDRRQSLLEADDRTGRLQSAAEERRDVTSIQARRAAQEVLDRGAARVSSDSSTAAGLRGEMRQLPAEPNELSTFPASGRKNDIASSLPLRSDALASGRSPQQTVPLSTGSLNGGDSPPAVTQGMSIVGEAAPALSSGPVQPGGQTSGHAARQVAEILSAGRIGQADSARAVTSTTGAHASGQGFDGPKGTPGMAGRSADTEADAKSSNEVAAKARSDFDQLVRSVRMRIGARHTTARLHLEPPQLGRVQVDVRMNGSQLQIGVRTETIDARNLLIQRAAALQTALEQCGINIERFEIVVDSLGERPADFEGTGDADVAAQSGEEGPLPRFHTKGSRPDALDTGVTVESESEPFSAVVAETRLDIRA